MKLKTPPLSVLLLTALVLGTVVGLWAGPKAEPLGEIGFVIVKLLKALATPLIFFAILDGFCKTDIPARNGFKLVVVTGVNACIAVIIALLVAHFFPLSHFVDLTQLRKTLLETTASPLQANGIPELSLKSVLNNLIPTSIGEPFVENKVLPVVLMAIIIGIALRKLKNSRSLRDEMAVIEKGISGIFHVILSILSFIVKWIPLAVFAIIAKMVGTAGFQIYSILGMFVAFIFCGLAIHVFVYYSFLLLTFIGLSPLTFFRLGGEALLTAFGTGSSLATLPVTLRTLQGKMKISPASARLAACVGTNLNHDGIILYEAMAALFVAEVVGVPMTMGTQVNLALTSILAAAGIAGIPEAGLITLSVVLTAVGLPLTAVAFLLPVDWLLGRMRATTNVASDMIVAHLLDQ